MKIKREYEQLLWMAVGFLAALALLGLSSCATKKSVNVESVRADTVTIWRVRADTVTITEPDTAAIRLLLECDERGNALAAILEQAQGKSMATSTAVRYVTVTDTAGRVSRKAYIDILALAELRKAQITSLETALAQKNESRVTETKTESDTLPFSYTLKFMSIGAVLGALFAILILRT